MARIRVFALTLLLNVVMVSSCSAGFREVQFGKYYQTSELAPLQWLVLDDKDGSYLLITKQCIEGVPFNEKKANVTWEECTLKKWLNDEFFRTAFTAQEQAAINPDKVFLLTADEVVKYMPEESQRQCSPTSRARSRGVYINENGLSAWWTSSPAEKPSQAVYLSSYGTFGNRPHYVDDIVVGVRPAVRVSKKFFEADTRKAEEVLYSLRPDYTMAQEVQTKIQPLLKQEAPFNVKELYEYFLHNPQKAVAEFDRKRITVEGVVLNTGPDRVYGEPSIELSDHEGGKCYILGVFSDAKAYSSVKAGDRIL